MIQGRSRRDTVEMLNVTSQRNVISPPTITNEAFKIYFLVHFIHLLWSDEAVDYDFNFKNVAWIKHIKKRVLEIEVKDRKQKMGLGTTDTFQCNI